MANCNGKEAPAEERLNKHIPATDTQTPTDPLKERLRIVFEENKYTPFNERKKLINPPKKNLTANWIEPWTKWTKSWANA